MGKNAEGTTFKRCGCTDPDTGKRLGTACPRLKRRNGAWNPKHGTWGFQIELPRTSTGTRRQARRVGLDTQDDGLNAINHVKNLLDLAEEDDEYTRSQIADLIHAAVKARSPLPKTEELRRRLAGGADVTAEAPTVAQWLKEWVDSAGIEESTRRSYRGHITNHLEPHLGPIRLDRLRVGHVQACFDAIAERNTHIRACRDSDDPQLKASVRGMRIIGPATMQRIRATLRRALNVAIGRPDIPLYLNPARHIVLPAVHRARPMVWTPERIEQWKRTGEIPSPVMVWPPELTRRFLERARRDRLYPLFHLITFKGPRRGEAVGLPWAETRLSEGTIDIRTQIIQLGWDTIVSTPKSRAGERTITLDKATIRELKKWRKRQTEERLAAGEGWHDTGLVFTHPDGSALHPAQITDLFHQLTREAGLPPIRLHDLRHGAASMSLAAGVDVKVVSAELGHATTGFTQDTYQSVFPEVAKAAAEATADLIFKSARD